MPLFTYLVALTLLSLAAGHYTQTGLDTNVAPLTPKEPVFRILVNDSLNFIPTQVKPILDKSTDFRLPTNLKAIDYRISFFPIPPKSSVFYGHVEIDLEVVKPTFAISLNIANLSLNSNSLMILTSSGERLKLINSSLDIEHQVQSFHLEKILPMGEKIEFSTSYEGKIKKGSAGLNQITYRAKDGAERRILATYMQPVGARHVFPCMDEPSLKARFVLQIGSSNEQTVLSNMPIDHVSLAKSGGYFWYRFQKSLPMSTYLVAFAISDFHARSNPRVRVWARRDIFQDSAFAAYLAPRCLEWFEGFLRVQYPMPKLDLVTLPSYAVSGMENFGLVTTRESSLLTDGRPSRREWVATVTAHEIAHQWAGNLVTPIWWSQYWLSEGFATYLAALALDQLEPHLEASNHLVVNHIHMTMNQDIAERGTVLVKEDFNPLVDDSKNLPMYYKGAALLRMLNSIYGEESFREALIQYFQTFQFSTASESDLYSTLGVPNEACRSRCTFRTNQTLPMTLDEIMMSWTRQKGYPLITLTKTSDGKVSARQEIFPKRDNTRQHTFPGLKPPSTEQFWWIPISFASSTKPDFSYTYPRTWLRPSEEEVFIEGVGLEDSWVIPNVQQTVYARINYDSSLWQAISHQLARDHKVIHVLNRAQLFNDAYQLFNQGYIEATPLMDILSYLGKEDNYFPLKSAFDSLRNIEIDMRGSVHYALLKNFALYLISPLLSSVFGRSHMEKKRYFLILSWACKFKIPTCSKFAREQFVNFQQIGDIRVFPDGDIEAFLCSAIEEGTASEWQFLFHKFLKMSKTNKTRRKVINAMACSQNETLIHRYMEDIISPIFNFTLDDAMEMYDALARSHLWNKDTWAFIARESTRLKERFGGSPLPFVVTAYDLAQLKLILEEGLKNSTTSSAFLSYFIEENESYAIKNSRIVSSVSSWLLQNSPNFQRI